VTRASQNVWNRSDRTDPDFARRPQRVGRCAGPSSGRRPVARGPRVAGPPGGGPVGTGCVDLAIDNLQAPDRIKTCGARASLIILGARPGPSWQGRIAKCDFRRSVKANQPHLCRYRRDPLRRRRQEHDETRTAGAILAVAFTTAASAQTSR